MKNSVSADVLILAVCGVLCIVINLLTWSRIGSLRDSFSFSVAADRIHSVVRSGDTEDTIITIRRFGEDYEDFVARHKTDVVALKTFLNK